MNELSTMIEVAKHLSSLKPPDLQCMLLIRTYFMNITPTNVSYYRYLNFQLIQLDKGAA
jgi:hypothetical protein